MPFLVIESVFNTFLCHLYSNHTYAWETYVVHPIVTARSTLNKNGDLRYIQVIKQFRIDFSANCPQTPIPVYVLTPFPSRPPSPPQRRYLIWQHINNLTTSYSYMSPPPSPPPPSLQHWGLRPLLSTSSNPSDNIP
jgi:hypothetical protein